MKKILAKAMIFGFLVVVASAGFLIASGTYHYPIPRGAGVAVGDLLYVERNDSMTNLSSSTAGKFLRSGGAATAPSWSTMILANAATTGGIMYGSATNTQSELTAGATAGMFLRNGGAATAPTWSTLVLANAATTGGIPYATATNTLGELAAGTAGKFLRAAGAVTAPAWSTLILANAATTGGISYATATNTLGELAAAESGKVLQGNGLVTAPSYIAKNIQRLASVHFANTRTTRALSADEALCKFLIVQSGGDTAVLTAIDSTGAEFVIRNLMGTSVLVTGGAGTATGTTVAAGFTAHVFHNGVGWVHAAPDTTN